MCYNYIGRYIDADPRHMELFMMSAEQYAGSIKATGGNHHFVFGILILLCLLAGIVTYNGREHINARLNNREPVPIAQAVTHTVQSITAQNKPQATQPSVRTDVPIATQIRTTLEIVDRDLRRRVDVNRDGLINCIDAAVLFYQHFPNKDIIRIYVNRNPATGMHHLFNLVLIDGVWRAIEPQAHWKNHRTYYMRDIWGRDYDHTLNRDVTSDYHKYVS